jgi:lysozyme
MTPSDRAHLFVKSFELLRLRAFLPTPNDVPTIGWGHTGPDVKLGMVWTNAQADAAYEADTAEVVAPLNRALFGIPTTQGQFDALFSFAYNEGIGAPALRGKGLLGSTLFRKHKVGDYAGAADEFPKWNKQAGVVLKGLTRRRAAERALYLS